jgi:CheY-like chemotaxis protein
LDEPSFARLRTLIVDDNVHMRALLRRMLGMRGVRETLEAADGHSAMAMLAAQTFDLVLLDLEMVPMNGIEFARLIRQQGKNSRVPIIMVSGHTELESVRKARDAGVNEFLVKPVTLKNLYSRIDEVFERPRPFVSCASYVGPERRRKDYGSSAPKRRDADKPRQVIELE